MKSFFKISLSLLLLNSCVTIVQDELDTMPAVPVLNGILQSDSSAWVHLSFSSTLSEANFPAIENARVILYEDGVLFEEIEHQYDGFYRGSLPLSTNVVYKCEVEVPGYGTLKATDVIPQAIAFKNENTDYGVPNDEGISQPRVNMNILHNPLKRDYFELKVMLIREGWDDYQMNEAVPVAPFDKVILDEGLETTLFSNNSMDAVPYHFNLHLFVNSFGCNDFGCSASIYPTIIELRTVSYHLYRYLQQAYLQEHAGIPEFGIGIPPPINSYSNVENGRGIFAAYAYMRSDTIPPPPRPF